MDITRLFVGIVMLLPLTLAMNLIARADTWRASVITLHLNWERHQRQSGPAEVPFNQRQTQQDRFEAIVTSRPMRLVWVHLTITLAAIVFCLALAWNADDLKWMGLWLVAPLGIAALLGTGYAWLILDGASAKLTQASTSLYGPAPPRVKVSSLRNPWSDWGT